MSNDPDDVQRAVEEFLGRQVPFAQVPRLADPVPDLVSARLVMEFADSRVVVFEAKGPAPSLVTVKHDPPDRTLDREQPVSLDLVSGLALCSPVTEIVLRVRAARGYSLRYLDTS